MIGENGTPATPDWTCQPICTRCDICETRQQAFWRHNPERDTHPTTYETAGNDGTD